MQTWTSDNNRNHCLQHVMLPFSLRPSTLGQDLRQSLQGVTLTSSLQTLTFDYQFDQRS